MYPRLTNAAGEGSKFVEEVEEIITCNPYRAAVVGSITLERREGNPEPEGKSNFVYIENIKTSINSIGLKNPGLNYYKNNLPNLLKNHPESFLILSIAYAPERDSNLAPELQFEILSRELFNIDKERIMVEVNLSCPSIDEDKILYEDVELTGKILEKVEKQVGEKRYTVKLGYMLPGHLNKTISLISSYNPFGIVAINSIPGMVVEKETSYFGSKYGGISGKTIQPFALYTVSKIRERLNTENRKDISVIGCGGISTPEDCFKFLKVGAEYLQVGTEFMAKRNKELFTRLLIELCSEGCII